MHPEDVTFKDKNIIKSIKKVDLKERISKTLSISDLQDLAQLGLSPKKAGVRLVYFADYPEVKRRNASLASAGAFSSSPASRNTPLFRKRAGIRSPYRTKRA